MDIDWHSLASDLGMYDDPLKTEKAASDVEIRKAPRKTSNNPVVPISTAGYRKIPGYPNYRVNKYGAVLNKHNKLLTGIHTVGGGKVTLYNDEGRVVVYRHYLIDITWPEYSSFIDEDTHLVNGIYYQTIPSDDAYAISRAGEIIRLRTQKPMSINRGQLMLSSNGSQRKRTVTKLLVEVYGYLPMAYVALHPNQRPS